MITSAAVIYNQTGKDRIQRFQFNGLTPELVARAFVEIQLRGRDGIHDVKLILVSEKVMELDLSKTVCPDIPESVMKMFGAAVNELS